MPDRRFNYSKKKRKVQLKCKFCFVFQPSFADKFYISWAFFLHEQRVTLRLALSVLSDIIISRNELAEFLFYLFLYFFIYSIFTALVLYQKSNLQTLTLTLFRNPNL